MSRSRGSGDSKVYVGDLSPSTSKEEIESAFSYYGPLRNVWVARNPPGFAFIEFDDIRDAEDAVRNLDGKRVGGRRVRVEISTGKDPRSRGAPRSSRRMKGFSPTDRCYRCGKRGHYAYDCADKWRAARSSLSRSRSRSRSRTPPRKRGRSPVRGRSRSRSRSRSSSSRSRSPTRSPTPKVKRHRRERSVSRSPKRRVSRSPSRSRSRSSSRSGDSRSRSPASKNGASRSRSRSG